MNTVPPVKALKRPAVVLAAALMAVGLLVGGLFGVAGLVSATPQSGDVAMIGSPDNINGGGPLLTSGGAFDTFNFTNLAPASVDADALSDFDTVVLNVASEEMDCETGTLSAGAKTDLVSFVQAGGKLIIYDTECPPNDYSWLPFPFTTANPGGQGGYGTLTIVENNTLSSNDPLDPYYIDAPNLGSQTDAVGDMNVMTTRDSHWCLDMEGTNVADETGPVHVYARYGSGLIIYNGLDIDYMGDEPAPPSPNGLDKIWLQELQQPFNPDNLLCRQRVVTPEETHKRSTPTPTPKATATPEPPTPTLPPPPPPPPPTATPYGGVGPEIVAPATGGGAETGAGLPWTIIGLAVAGAVGAVAGLGGYRMSSTRSSDR
jgi:hypothetical protein